MYDSVCGRDFNNPPRGTAATRGAAASASVDMDTAALVLSKEVDDLGK